MDLNDSWVGVSAPSETKSWNSKDALLYALGVGAGQEDPFQELAFTTENSVGVEQRVLPTFANVALSCEPMLPTGIDLKDVLHAGQAFTLERPIPLEGTVTTTSTILGVYDKRSGALIDTECVATTPAGDVMARMRVAVFVRGAGGFGGEPAPVDEWELPTGTPDHTVTYTPALSQPLLYRLSGDRNPIHSDPTFSAAAGFDQPILHGMCTYGFTGRALLHSTAGGDVDRFHAMSGRFTTPVLPGNPLTVQIWQDGQDVRYRTLNENGQVVIDRGTARVS